MADLNIDYCQLEVEMCSLRRLLHRFPEAGRSWRDRIAAARNHPNSDFGSFRELFADDLAKELGAWTVADLISSKVKRIRVGEIPAQEIGARPFRDLVIEKLGAGSDHSMDIGEAATDDAFAPILAELVASQVRDRIGIDLEIAAVRDALRIAWRPSNDCEELNDRDRPMDAFIGLLIAAHELRGWSASSAACEVRRLRQHLRASVGADHEPSAKPKSADSIYCAFSALLRAKLDRESEAELRPILDRLLRTSPHGA